MPAPGKTRRSDRPAIKAAACVLMIISLVGASDRTAPKVFEPGVISTAASDAAITFSADGRVLLFERSVKGASIILESRHRGGRWTRPRVASFSGRWLDLEPALAPDGSYVIFVSNRPLVAGGPALDGYYAGSRHPGSGGALWRANRVEGGWGEPYPLPPNVNVGTSTYEPSLAANGDLYFQRADASGGRFQLYVARRTSSGYEDASRLDLHGGEQSSDMDPAIARDGSYLLFASDRASRENRLFIAFMAGNGWTAPTQLGKDVNGEGSVGDPRIGPEADRLYFTSRRLAEFKGRPAADLASMTAWNSGLPNIWSVNFRAADWRRAGIEGAASPRSDSAAPASIPTKDR